MHLMVLASAAFRPVQGLCTAEPSLAKLLQPGHCAQTLQHAKRIMFSRNSASSCSCTVRPADCSAQCVMCELMTVWCTTAVKSH